MPKKNKYLLLGLGLTTLATIAFSPIVYYEIKAQKHINSKEYNKAGNIYNKLSFLSSKYIDRAALCYYDHFIYKYENPSFIGAYNPFLTNPMVERDPHTNKKTFIIDNTESTPFKLKELFETTTRLSYEQYLIRHGKKKNSPTKTQQKIQHMLHLSSKLDIKNKKYLEEGIKAIEVEAYAEHTIFATHENQLEDASKYLTIAIDKYKQLYNSSTIPQVQQNIQYSILKIYSQHPKPLSPNKSQKAFTEKLLKYIDFVTKQNQELVKKNGSGFSLTHSIPLKNTAELNNICSKFIHTYQHEYTEFKYFHKRIEREFDQFCYNLREKYSKNHKNFSNINHIYSIIRNEDLQTNIQATKLNDLAQQYSKNKNKPLNDISALFSIEHHHIYALQQAKEGNPLIAKQHLNAAVQIYQQYKTQQQGIFNTYYRSLCQSMNENLLYTFKRNPKKKYLKEMATSVVEAIE